MSDIEITPASEMLLKIRNTESVSRKELEMILTTEDEAFLQELYRQARETAREYYGNQKITVITAESAVGTRTHSATALQQIRSWNVVKPDGTWDFERSSCREEKTPVTQMKKSARSSARSRKNTRTVQ